MVRAIRIEAVGYEAWCEVCNDGSGTTAQAEAKKWKAEHIKTEFHRTNLKTTRATGQCDPPIPRKVGA